MEMKNKCEGLSITREQCEALKGFYFSLHSYTFYRQQSESFDSGFYAEKLDDLNIPWAIQNRISWEAQEYDSHRYYFSTLLKRNNITVRDK